MLKQLFWNDEERRVRAFWRLVSQLIITVIGVACIGVLATPIMLLQESVDLTTGELRSSMTNAFVLSGIMALVGIMTSLLLSGRFLDRRKFADFGFHLNGQWWRDLGFGMTLGAVLMGGIFLMELAAGWVTITGTLGATDPTITFTAGIILQVIGFLCVGIYEEALSRGYQLRNIAEGLNLPALNPRIALIAGWVLSSIVFGALHIGNPNATLISTLNIALAGIFLGLGYVLTGELAIPIGLHITWNFFQGNVFGFPVSGNPSSVSFINITQGGPDLFTGGMFGPEAGLMGVLGMLVGCGLIMLWVRWQYGEVKLRDDLAVYVREERIQDTGERIPEEILETSETPML